VPLTTRDPREMLEQGRADVAVGFFPDLDGLPLADQRAEDDASFRRAPLYASEYVCVMRGDHPLAAPGALSLDAFCAAQHLRVSFAGRSRGFVDDALAGLGRQRNVVMIVNSFFTGALALRRSDLLTVLPNSFIAAFGSAAGLVIRELPFALTRIAICQLWHARHTHDPAQRWLREELTRAVDEMAAGTAPDGGVTLTH
jgi:DNA-binding transcriptional LysR family regulator